MLRFRVPVPCSSVTPAQARRLRQGQFQSLVLGDKTAVRAIMLQKLGLWPRDCNLQATLVGLVPNGDLEWYDHEAHTIVSISGSRQSMSEALGVNGRLSLLLSGLGVNVDRLYRTYLLEHALQDQWFSLSRMYAQANGNMDRLFAAVALCEGDALYSTALTAAEPLGMRPDALVSTAASISPSKIFARLSGQIPELYSVPPLFRDYLVSVLVDGLKFVHSVRQHGGWGALNRVFRDGACSSKQILHPVQYLNNAELFSVSVDFEPPRQLGEWQRLDSDCAGEFLIGCWAKSKLSEANAQAIACGWLADKWWVYSCKDKDEEQCLLVWASVWESQQDAREFADFSKSCGAEVRVNASQKTVLAVLGGQPAMLDSLNDGAIKVRYGHGN